MTDTPRVDSPARPAARIRRTVAAAALTLLLAVQPGATQESYFEGPVPPDLCRPDDERKEVLLLGSYHMSNPGADRFNLESDDVLVTDRQAEIRAIVDRLERFAPTHVAVEAPWGDTVTIERYRAFATDGGDLRRSEEEQIGFRLARRVGHETIHPVDVRIGLDFEAVARLAAQDPRLGRKLGEMEAVGEEAVDLMAEKLAQGSIGSMLRWMNEPDNLRRAHSVYLDFFVPVAVGDDYAGADMVAEWYRRNLRIFANLTRIATEPDARLFVVFGQGHIPILRQALIDHSDFCVEDPLPYLEGL